MTSDIHEMTGAYALDALPDEERLSFERHLDVCDDCRREVAELKDTAARLAASSAEPPPPRLREAVLGEIGRVTQEAPVAARPAPADSTVRARSFSQPRWAMLLAPAAAVLILAVVGLGVMVGSLNQRLDRLDDSSDRLTNILAAEDIEARTIEGPAGSSARIMMAPSRGEAVFVASDLASAGPEQTYQFWLIGDDGPIPAGLLDTEEDGPSVGLISGDMTHAAAIAVTVEPAGGSAQPTNDPIMVAELS